MSNPRRLSLTTPVPHPERLWWLAAVAVALALSNATILPMLGQERAPETWLGLGVGGIFAQVLILAFFAVFGPGAHVPRQATVWLLLVVLIGSFAMGVKFARSSPSIITNPSDELLFSMSAMPIMMCVSQAPLWLLRYFLGWRMFTCDEKIWNRQRFSIRGMLTATAVIGAALGVGRLGLTSWANGMAWWSGIGIASAAALLVSVLVLPVTSLLVLRSQSGKRGCIAAGFYLAGCVLGVVLIASSIEGRPLRSEACQLLLMIYASITGYVLTSLAIFRSAGYRLRWGWEAG